MSVGAVPDNVTPSSACSEEDAAEYQRGYQAARGLLVKDAADRDAQIRDGLPPPAVPFASFTTLISIVQAPRADGRISAVENGFLCALLDTALSAKVQ